MAGSTPMDPNPLQAVGSPLAVSTQSYLSVMRSQLEMTMQLTAAWTAAMSVLSSRMLAPGSVADGASGQASPRGWSSGFDGLRAVGNVDSGGHPAPEGRSAGSTLRRPLFDQPGPGRMLRWLTEPPTLQTNLFDETIELLVDEDIKTAS